MNRYLAGAIAGTIATIPMTWVMARLFERLPTDNQYPLPPREITDEATRRIGYREKLSEKQQGTLSLAAHFAYGGLTGALYPVALSGAVKGKPGRQMVFGAGYGVAIWAGSYFGWVPATKLLGLPSAQPISRLRLMIVAHLVWGASTVVLAEKLARESREAQRISTTGNLE